MCRLFVNVINYLFTRCYYIVLHAVENEEEEETKRKNVKKNATQRRLKKRKKRKQRGRIGRKMQHKDD